MEKLTLDQERAKHALEAIEALQQGGAYGHYPSYVNRMPAMIVMNGLGQACAMLLAQARGDAEDPHRMLYDHLEAWLCRQSQYAPYRGEAPLISAIVSKNQRVYVEAQSEALAYLGWLKRFAQAYLTSPEGRGDE